MTRASWLCAGGLMLLTLSGCPVTDDFYIESGSKLAGQAGSSGAESAGGTAGTPQAGTASIAPGGSAAGGSDNPAGGATVFGAAGSLDAAGGAPYVGQGGAAPAPCEPKTERCNGHDDDCDGLVDELVCNSNQNGTVGCVGFTLSSGSTHGYMLCTGSRKDWTRARKSCGDQDMRLAWLESADENTAVAATILKLTSETEVLFGATDQDREGDWFWDGGAQFRHGNYPSGYAIDGAFEAWAPGTPDNLNNNEDCATLNPQAATWSDRNCSATYAYLCEEKL